MAPVIEVGRVVVVVLTYKRPVDLAELLPMLDAQARDVDEDVAVMVIDNDPDAGGREVVADLGIPRVTYVHEPAPGIANARNRALDETVGAHLLIFIDDDERPTATWLVSLVGTYKASGSVAVVGPVLPEYESTPDPWIEAGAFFVRKLHVTGDELPAAGTGNLLLDLHQVERLGPLRFDLRFGMTGGSDTLFTRSLTRCGGKILWCEEAAVIDKIPAQRLTRPWVLKRAFRSGNSWSRTSLELERRGLRKLRTRLVLTARGLVRIAGGSARCAVGVALRSQKQHARGSRTIARGVGMSSGAWGAVYHEYRRHPAKVDVARNRLRLPLSGSAERRARTTVRWVRKRAKRGWSHVWLAALKVRNRFSSASVLGTGPVVVSLTSYGARVETVAFAIESIASGELRPRRLILWLDDQARFDSRPISLRRLERRGVEILVTDNLGPHTKYFPYVDSAQPHSLPLVTADDDVLYPRRWLRELHEAYGEHPDTVNCYRASTVPVENGQIAQYMSWPRCKDTAASVSHFATGVAGVIYPPPMLDELAERGTQFVDFCPRADDIWLHWVALQSGVRVRQISKTPRHFPVIPGTQSEALVAENVHEGGNDRWIQKLYSSSDIALVEGAAAEK